MEINDHLVLKPNPEITSREYLKSVVIEPGIALNETAASVFKLCDGKRTLGEICRAMTVEFDVGYDVCYRDTVELVGSMLEQGLLVQV